MCKCSKNEGFTLFPYIHKLHNNVYHLLAVQLLKASFFIWPILPRKEKKEGIEKAIKYFLLLHFSQGWHWLGLKSFQASGYKQPESKNTLQLSCNRWQVSTTRPLFKPGRFHPKPGWHLLVPIFKSSSRSLHNLCGWRRSEMWPD